MKPSVIWKNHEGFRYCKNCWSCHQSNLVAQKPTENLIPVVLPNVKKRPRIKLKSEKQKALDKAYLLIRILYVMLKYQKIVSLMLLIYITWKEEVKKH
jgi:hypothetical protein